MGEILDIRTQQVQLVDRSFSRLEQAWNVLGCAVDVNPRIPGVYTVDDDSEGDGSADYGDILSDGSITHEDVVQYVKTRLGLL